MSDDKIIGEYRGFPIVLTPNLQFRATVARQGLVSSSFDGLKKKIQAAAAFEPFDGLTFRYGKIERVRIIGRDSDDRWILESGGGVDRHARIYTPDQKQAMIAHAAAVLEAKAQQDETNKKLNAVYEALTRHPQTIEPK